MYCVLLSAVLEARYRRSNEYVERKTLQGQQGMQFEDAVKYESMYLQDSESDSKAKRQTILLEIFCLVFENLPKLIFNGYLFNRFMFVVPDEQFASSLARPVFFAILSEVRTVFGYITIM